MSTDAGVLRVLFSMRHLGFFRMYESVVRELARRGHAVHLVFDRGERIFNVGLQRPISLYDHHDLSHLRGQDACLGREQQRR